MCVKYYKHHVKCLVLICNCNNNYHLHLHCHWIWGDHGVPSICSFTSTGALWSGASVVTSCFLSKEYDKFDTFSALELSGNFNWLVWLSFTISSLRVVGFTSIIDMSWKVSFSLNCFPILQDWNAEVGMLVVGPDFRPVLILSGFNDFPGALYFGCAFGVKPDIFLPQQSTCKTLVLLFQTHRRRERWRSLAVSWIWQRGTGRQGKPHGQ